MVAVGDPPRPLEDHLAVLRQQGSAREGLGLGETVEERAELGPRLSTVSGGGGGVPFGGRAGWICIPVIRSSGVPSKVSERPCQPWVRRFLAITTTRFGGPPST